MNEQISNSITFIKNINWLPKLRSQVMSREEYYLGKKHIIINFHNKKKFHWVQTIYEIYMHHKKSESSFCIIVLVPLKYLLCKWELYPQISCPIFLPDLIEVWNIYERYFSCYIFFFCKLIIICSLKHGSKKVSICKSTWNDS